MKSFRLDRWVKQIMETEEQEISCSDCLDLVDQYVEAELAGAPLGTQLAGVRQHLAQCKVCREEYEALRDLVREERTGRAPSAEDSMKPL